MRRFRVNVHGGKHKNVFETEVNTFIDAYLSRRVAVVFMSVLKRSNPRFCSPEVYIDRSKIADRILKNKAVQHNSVNVYRPDYEDSDGVHFTEEGYQVLLVALRKTRSWFINTNSK